MLKKFKYFRINEHIDTSKKLSINDPEILKLNQLIEDSFEKAIISYFIYNDTFGNDNGYPIEERSMSVAFRIASISEIIIAGNGNPYNNSPIEFSQASESLISVIKSKKLELTLAEEVKSLLYRLEKIGYKISNFSYKESTDSIGNGYSGYYEIIIIIRDKKLIF